MAARTLLFILVIPLFGACTPKPEPKTVEYYLQNEQVRNLVRAECKNNPGGLKEDPDCINASAAERRADKNVAKNKTLPPIKF